MSLLPETKPRFKGCPPICETANLPIFWTENDAKKWLDKYSPGAHVINILSCEDHFHAHTVARGPSGESSGHGRYAKFYGKDAHEDESAEKISENPRPIITVSDTEISKLRVIATERYERRKYSERDDQWGQGLDPDGIFKGCLGELACFKFLKASGIHGKWDPRAMKYGDGNIDITCDKGTIDVKTGTFLIKYADKDGRLNKIKSDIYVFAKIAVEFHLIQLIGWMPVETVKSQSKKHARKGDHINYDCNVYDMSPMPDLVTFLK